MSRTKYVMTQRSRCVSQYMHRSKRRNNHSVLGKGHRALRLHNKEKSEINFTPFKKSPYRKSFKAGRIEANLFKNRFDDETYKTKAEECIPLILRIEEKLDYLLKNPQENHKGWVRKDRDYILAVHKKLIRRGSLSAFTGHRIKGQLYKRELAYWMWDYRIHDY